MEDELKEAGSTVDAPLDSKYVPGVWRRGSTLYELRCSSLGTPIFIDQSGGPFAPNPDHMREFVLVEPGATLSSPLFRLRSPEGGGEDLVLLQLTRAGAVAVAGFAQNPGYTEEVLGRMAVRFARAALAELRRGAGTR